jgi:hypothetical protein
MRKYHIIQATSSCRNNNCGFWCYLYLDRDSVVSPIQEGEGFKVIAIWFLIGGMVSILLAFIAKYFMLIKYLLRQIGYKGKSAGDKFYDCPKPKGLCVSLT